MNKLWLKSEGSNENGAVSNSDPEVVYDHPIFRPHSLDARAGIRADLDSDSCRASAVFGVDRVAPYSVEVAPTLSGRNGCYGAGRATDSTHLPLRQKWIFRPQAELNVYSKKDVPLKLDRASPTSKPGFVCAPNSATNSHRKLDSRTTADSAETAGCGRQAGQPTSGIRFIFGFRICY
jgi:copper resistance protein B